MKPYRGPIQILADFLEGLNAAEGAASQLVTVRANPKWMAVRDMLHIISDSCKASIIEEAGKST